MKRVAILGSTGSIGQNTLEVISSLPHEFDIIGISTNTNIDILYRQIKRFSPKVAAVANTNCANVLKSKLNNRVKLFMGEAAVDELLSDKRLDLVVLAISGSAALLPLIKAIDMGKDIALANKEALVVAGNIIMQKARKKKVKIFPIDSEQSAIWQCLDGKEKNTLKKIYLTASGGPLRELNPSEFQNISVRDVLRHPRWKMGKKVTVDSATLMNKGLELIETMHLFEVTVPQIQIMIHPEAIIHSMVEFIDGSILAQLSVTDMRIPIQYALTYPKRYYSPLTSINFFKLKKLTFYKPNLSKFPCLRLCLEAALRGGTAPCALNAANEVAVEAFLNKKINFVSIPKIIEKVLSTHKNISHPQLEDVFRTDTATRKVVEEFVDRLA